MAGTISRTSRNDSKASSRPSRRVIELEKLLLDDREYLHPQDLPVEFIEGAVTLSDEDAMKLAARLFMMDEWRYIRLSVIIFNAKTGDILIATSSQATVDDEGYATLQCTFNL